MLLYYLHVGLKSGAPQGALFLLLLALLANIRLEKTCLREKLWLLLSEH
jgi:hypothetical protein